jgi:hypothetical protein
MTDTLTVTAGPFCDPDSKRRGRDWVVVTRTGLVVTHHRFSTQEAAQAFADGEPAPLTPPTSPIPNPVLDPAAFKAHVEETIRTHTKEHAA